MYYKKKAFAFSITMWIIASLLFATVVILRFAKDEVHLSIGLNNKLQTQMRAESILEALKFYIPTADYTSISLKSNLLSELIYPFPSEIIADGREYNLTEEITLSLKDTSAMLNVMYTPSEIIAKALSSRKNEELSYVLKDSLEDWRDIDTMAKINGAEQNTYRTLGQKIAVRNTKAIQSIYELKLIYGYKDVDFKDIKSNLYYGQGSSINLMLISNKRYLAFLLGVDENFILKMLELRKVDPLLFIKNLDTLPKYDDESMGFGLSKQFLISIKVRKGRAMSVLNTIISFNELNDKPYITVSYSIN